MVSESIHTYSMDGFLEFRGQGKGEEVLWKLVTDFKFGVFTPSLFYS